MQSASVDGFRMRVRSEYTTRGTRGIRQNIDDQWLLWHSGSTNSGTTLSEDIDYQSLFSNFIFWCMYHPCFQIIFHVYSLSQSECYHSDIKIITLVVMISINSWLWIHPHGRSQLNSFKLVFQVTKKLVFSGSSKALQLQQFIEANIYHRQGFVYGAKENRKLQMFLDDLNLPVPDKDGVQRVSIKLVRTINIEQKRKRLLSVIC